MKISCRDRLAMNASSKDDNEGNMHAGVPAPALPPASAWMALTIIIKVTVSEVDATVQQLLQEISDGNLLERLTHSDEDAQLVQIRVQSIQQVCSRSPICSQQELSLGDSI